MKNVRIGIIGASWFADLWYLPVLQMHPGAEIAAVCSENGKSAKQMSTKYGGASVYTSYNSMIENESLDGICVVTPNRTHADMVMAAVKKGVHVICEKPLALNKEESSKIIESIKNTPIIHAVNFTYRENPAVKQMKSAIRENKIGRILEADFEYTGEYGILASPGWRGNIPLGGAGGVLADLGSHLIDLAHYLFDSSIKPLSASYQTLKRDKPDQERAPDSVFFTAMLPCKVISSFQTSWVRHQGGNGQTIKINLYGERGKMELLSTENGIELTVQNEYKKTYTWKESEEGREENFRPWRLTPQNEVWKWIDRIANPSVFIEQPDFYDGHNVQVVMDEILELANSKTLIK